jgi:hypothetical protein
VTEDIWLEHETPVDLVKVITDTEIEPPLLPELHTHWLSIDGKRPNIPENQVSGYSEPTPMETAADSG